MHVLSQSMCVKSNCGISQMEQYTEETFSVFSQCRVKEITGEKVTNKELEPSKQHWGAALMCRQEHLSLSMTLKGQSWANQRTAVAEKGHRSFLTPPTPLSCLACYGPDRIPGSRPFDKGGVTQVWLLDVTPCILCYIPCVLNLQMPEKSDHFLTMYVITDLTHIYCSVSKVMMCDFLTFL